MYFLMNTRGDVFSRSPHVYENELENYNCGGYALGIYEWYMPYMLPYKAEGIYGEAEYEADYYEETDESDEAITARENFWYWEDNISEVIDGFRELYYECFHTTVDEDDEDYLAEWDSEDAVQLSVFNMLRQFKWLRRIDSWKELKKDEYGIVFGVGHGDFHFVRYEHGIYTHKMGGGDIEVVSKWEEAFYCGWMTDMRYNLGHVFFAAKKEEFR